MTARSDDTPARRNALVDRLKAPRKTDITTTIKRTVCIDSWLVTKGRSVDMQKKYNNDRQSRVDTETKRQLIIVILATRRKVANASRLHVPTSKSRVILRLSSPERRPPLIFVFRAVSSRINGNVRVLWIAVKAASQSATLLMTYLSCKK